MIRKFEIGDEVAVLDDDISGIVVQVQNEQISIKTTDDFMMTFFVNELVKINNSNDLSVFFFKSKFKFCIERKRAPKKAKFC